MSKRIFLAVGVPVLLLVAMAGCGHSQDNNNTPASMTNSAPAITPPATTTNVELPNTNNLTTTNHTTP